MIKHFLSIYQSIPGVILLFLFVLLLFFLSISEKVRGIGNAPAVDNIIITDASGGAATSTFILTEAITRTLYVRGAITDLDGCSDVAASGTVTGKFYRTNHASGSDCSVDNNDCYSMANSVCSKTNCNPPGDNTFDYECSASIAYYADTTTSGANSSTNWTAKITATDSEILNGSATSTIEVADLIALDIPSSITYGLLDWDATSNQQTLIVTNTGNIGLDVDLSVNGGMMCGIGSIPAAGVHYASSSGFAYNQGISLSAGATEFELDLAQRTNDAASSTSNLYFLLRSLSSGLAGACSNTLTVTGKADTENGW